MLGGVIGPIEEGTVEAERVKGGIGISACGEW